MRKKTATTSLLNIRHSLVVLFGLTSVVPAFAQDSETTTSFSGLEEIVVTARKRQENLQDVPESISTFTNGDIEDKRIETIDDIANLVPNLYFFSGPLKGASSLTIRGIGQARNQPPPVAILYDGVQIISPQQVTQELFDLERIEVLKGAQGSSYGRNAIGGAINFITREPTSEFEGRVKLSAGNGDDYKIQSSISGAIVEDKLLYRVSGGYEDFGGLIQNVTLNEKADSFDDRYFRGRLMYFPTEELTLDFRISHSDFDGLCCSFIALPDGQSNNVDSDVNLNLAVFQKRKLDDLAMKIDYDLGFATFSSITSYAKVKESSFRDLDFTPNQGLAASQVFDFEAWNQEFRLTSSDDSEFRWLVGADYLSNENSVDTGVYLDKPEGLVSLANPIDDREYKTVGVFGQFEYDLSEDLTASLALRYDSDKRKQTSRASGVTKEETFSEVQPKASLSYHLSDDVMTYITVSRGFRSGGFNQEVGIFPAVFKADKATQYEAGIKSTLMDNRVRFNAAVFSIDYDDSQVFLLDSASGAQGIINVNESKVKGIEIDLLAAPTDGLELSSSLGLIDSEIVDFNGTGLYDGKHLPRSHGWSLTLSGQYTRPVGDDMEFVGRIDVPSVGDLYWHTDNVDKQDSYTLVNTKLSLGKADAWQVTLFAKNLLDEEYTPEFYARRFIGAARDIRYPSTPRQYGVELTLDF